jgi:hypothetical protein
MVDKSQKFTTYEVGPPNQKPVAQLAFTKVNSTLGAIIQLDGRKSYDPEKRPLTWKWRFVVVPTGSQVKNTGFKDIRPRSTAVSFIPDNIGTYIIELVVNDGELDSNPITATVSIQFSEVPVGENIIPDARFLWDYISNFWQLVEDREKITSIWSAVIQLLGAEVIKLWGYDYNKALSTIQQAVQRRWQKVSMRTDLTAFSDHRVIVGKTDSGLGGRSGSIGQVPTIGNTSAFYVPLGRPGDGDHTDFTNLMGNYGPSGRLLIVNDEAHVIDRVGNKGLLIKLGIDLVFSTGSNIVSSLSSDFTLLKVQVGDRLVIRTGVNSGTYKVAAVSGSNLTVVHLSDPPGGPYPSFTAQTGVGFAVGRPYSAVFLRYTTLPDGIIGAEWRVPHLLHVPGANFGLNGVRAGDVLVLEVTRNDIKLSAEMRVRIVGAIEDRLGFEFTTEDLDPALNLGSGASIIESGGIVTVTGLSGMKPSSVNGYLEIATGDNPGSFRIQTYISSTSVTISNLAASGADSGNPNIEWTERARTGTNLERALFRKLAVDLRLVSPQSSDVDIAAMAEALIAYIPVGINLSTRPFTPQKITFRAKQVIHNSWVPVPIETISIPALQETLIDPPVVLRENLDYTVSNGMVSFVSGLFTVKNPTPEEFWAESALYDNSDVIEKNFGRLVGLLKDDLTSSKTKAPYLSAVRGLFFAYTNGPTIRNIRLGLQILLGLPFTEERGIIKELQENFTKDAKGGFLGRVLIEDLDDSDRLTGNRRVYFYPTEVGLETNSVTARPYKAGDFIDRFSPISKGVEVKDYIKDPYWWKNALYGLEILKYFTFKIVIDSKVFDANDVQFALDFVNSFKPTYTKIIATALVSLADDIEVEDVFGGRVVCRFYDNTWGLEACNKASDDNQEGFVLWQAGSKPLQTRTLHLLRDVRTYGFPEDGPPYTAVRASSVTGWNANHVRARSLTGTPVVEGDILAILSGQPGAPSAAPGLYEIREVVDSNTFELLQVTSFTDPTTFEVTPLDEDLFEYGENLVCVLLRRGLNPIIRPEDEDLVTAAPNIVTSASAGFMRNAVSIGDRLIIEPPSANQGEYVIEALTPYDSGPPVVPPLFSETQVTLLWPDGTAPVLAPLSDQSFRVIRLSAQPGVVYGGKSVYNMVDFQMELEVLDPNTGDPLEVFTPGMVGTTIEVSNSQNPVNDGLHMITGYLNSGRVILNLSPSTTSDLLVAQATIYFRSVT